MLDFITCYEKLKVSETATKEEIKKQWRKLVQDLHPDKLQSVPQGLRELAEEELKEINNAWDILKDDARRAEYDEFLKRARQNAGNEAAAQAAAQARAEKDVADAARARAAKDAADRAARVAAQAARKNAQSASSATAPQSTQSAPASGQSHAAPTARQTTPPPPFKTTAPSPNVVFKFRDRAFGLIFFAIVSAPFVLWGYVAATGFMGHDARLASLQALQSTSSSDAQVASQKRFEGKVLHLINSEHGCTLGPDESCGDEDPAVVYYKIVFNAVDRMESGLADQWMKGMGAAAERCKKATSPSCVCNVIKYRYEYGRSDGHERILGMSDAGCRNAKDNVDAYSTAFMKKYGKLSDFDKLAMERSCDATTHYNPSLRSGIQACKLWDEIIKHEPVVCILGKNRDGSSIGPHIFLRIYFKRDSERLNIGEYGYAGENGAVVYGFHNESGGDTHWRIPKAEGGEVCKDAVDD